jgi:peroxiredoxin
MSTLATKAPALKRFFVMPFFALNGLGLIYALVRVVIAATGSGHGTAGWAIAVATHGAVLAYAMRSWPQPDSDLRGELVATSAGAIALAALLPGSLAPLIQVAVIATAGSFLYVLWYARFAPRAAQALTAGTLLPELTLRTLDGEQFSTARLRGAPAAMFFYRGSWCPFCTAQIRAIVAGYERLAARGIKVAMVSPQPDKETQKLCKRFGVELLWLQDHDLAAARKLGIVDPGGVPAGAVGFGVDTVLPTLVVLDADGRVIAAHETDSYRLRPDPETVLSIIDGPHGSTPAHAAPHSNRTAVVQSGL